LANDYPKDRLQVLVVDGMSEDRTPGIVRDYTRRYPFVQLLENPKKSIPAAMNTGITRAKSSVVIKMDAHSTYQPDHISACVRYQEEFGAENVGGIVKILPGAETEIGRGIVLVLQHWFGSGNAHIKVGVDKPTWSDAAAFGCYRKILFEKVGLFNERLQGSSDMDMNVRIRSHGGRILLVPDIVITYYTDATLRAFWKHNFADGVWATYVLKFGSKAWSWRHWAPMVFTGSLLGCLLFSLAIPNFVYPTAITAGAYAAANFAASIQIALRERALRCLPVLPVAFVTRHIAHGLGALFGLALVLLPGEPWKGRRQGKA
jgi:glycosyltransferase involved in cell wall biosynthesis